MAARNLNRISAAAGNSASKLCIQTTASSGCMSRSAEPPTAAHPRPGSGLWGASWQLPRRIGVMHAGNTLNPSVHITKQSGPHPPTQGPPVNSAWSLADSALKKSRFKKLNSTLGREGEGSKTEPWLEAGPPAASTEHSLQAKHSTEQILQATHCLAHTPDARRAQRERKHARQLPAGGDPVLRLHPVGQYELQQARQPKQTARKLGLRHAALDRLCKILAPEQAGGTC